MRVGAATPFFMPTGPRKDLNFASTGIAEPAQLIDVMPTILDVAGA